MRIYCQCRCFFFERLTLRVRAAYSHRNLHQYPLAPSARAWMTLIGSHGTSNGTSYIFNIPRGDGKSRGNEPMRMQKSTLLSAEFFQVAGAIRLSGRLALRPSALRVEVDGQDVPRPDRQAGALQSVHSRAYRAQDKSDEVARFSAPGPVASLPIAPASPPCGESQTAAGTWSSGSPSIDRSGPYRSPHSDRACGL